MTEQTHTASDFERLHGQNKINRLQEQLAAERRKVSDILRSQSKPIELPINSSNIKFGVTGDRHHGSLYHNAEGLAAFYRACGEMGITTIVDAGDMLDGWKVYKGQEFELSAIGYEEQLDSLVNDTPRIDGIETVFITGNHDASFKNLAGVNVGAAISARRPDMRFIGEYSGHVNFSAPDGRMYAVQLVHPGGGTPYALSYKPQKIIEQMEGGTKPNMLIIGHFHKAELLPTYRNVAAIQSGTFQWQTPFMARFPSAANVGAWIVEVEMGESFNRVRAEFISFYR